MASSPHLLVPQGSNGLAHRHRLQRVAATPAPDENQLAINRSHIINSNHAKQCGWHKSRLKYASVSSRRSSTVTAHQSQHQGYLRATARPCSAHWQRSQASPLPDPSSRWRMATSGSRQRPSWHTLSTDYNVAQSPISKSGFARSSKQKRQQVGVSEPKL